MRAHESTDGESARDVWVPVLWIAIGVLSAGMLACWLIGL